MWTKVAVSCVALSYLLLPDEGASVVSMELATDLNRLSSDLGVSMSEGCFIFDFAPLPFGVAGPIPPALCTKVAVKH